MLHISEVAAASSDTCSDQDRRESHPYSNVLVLSADTLNRADGDIAVDGNNQGSSSQVVIMGSRVQCDRTSGNLLAQENINFLSRLGWRPPTASFVKINCDGAKSLNSTDAGLGVCRDEHGFLLQATALSFEAQNVLVAEANAIREGMQIAIRR